MVQRGHGQLVDILLIGWCEISGSQHPLPSGSNLSGVFVLVDSLPSLTFNFSHLVGVSVSAKQSKDIVCIPRWETRTLPQASPIVSFGCYFPVSVSGICLQCRRPRFNPWVGKSPWRRKWQTTPIFLPGESQWTEKPGGPQATRSQRVGHNRETNTFTPVSASPPFPN